MTGGQSIIGSGFTVINSTKLPRKVIVLGPAGALL